MVMGYPRSTSWVGMQCGLCEYAVVSPDTREGCEELMMLHINESHPGISWLDSKGRMHIAKGVDEDG